VSKKAAEHHKKASEHHSHAAHHHGNQRNITKADNMRRRHTTLTRPELMPFMLGTTLKTGFALSRRSADCEFTDRWTTF
jgi:hypothetical protein